MTTLWEGRPATTEQLAFLGLSSYGCYTFFQVRRGATRGCSLHLARLRSNALELFGAAPADDRIRELVDGAVPGDCSVRVTLASRDADAVLAGGPVLPEVVVTVSPARNSSTEPIAVRTVSYERETPWVKHRATYGPQRQTRAARQAGFDDALFVDRNGAVSEGPTWNALFHHDGTWVWPEAAVLPGVTMQLLRQAMDQERADQRAVLPADLPHSGFALNATSPARPLARIDDHSLVSGGAALQELQELWQAIEPEPW